MTGQLSDLIRLFFISRDVAMQRLYTCIPIPIGKEIDSL